MTKECVLNELSILDFDEHRHNAASTMASFVALWDTVGATRLSIWEEVLAYEPSSDEGRLLKQRYGHLLRIGDKSARDRDQWRRVRARFNRAEAFATSSPETATFKGSPARGLNGAHKMSGLALSLDTEDRWDAPWLDLKLGPILVGPVRHAAQKKHLAQHEDWAPLTDSERLRFLLESSKTEHKPASEYRSGKHVQGATDEKRKSIASKPGGNAQYLSHWRGEKVTDDQIRHWEEEALSRVRSGSDACTVHHRGSGMYWVFCDLGEVVGYEGGTGEPITSVRVERSSGTVHSHPRRPPT